MVFFTHQANEPNSLWVTDALKQLNEVARETKPSGNVPTASPTSIPGANPVSNQEIAKIAIDTITPAIEAIAKSVHHNKEGSLAIDHALLNRLTDLELQVDCIKHLLIGENCTIDN